MLIADVALRDCPLAEPDEAHMRKKTKKTQRQRSSRCGGKMVG